MSEARRGRCARQGGADARGKERHMREARHMHEAMQGRCAMQGKADARCKAGKLCESKSGQQNEARPR
jgi:hypothetical protein